MVVQGNTNIEGRLHHVMALFGLLTLIHFFNVDKGCLVVQLFKNRRVSYCFIVALIVDVLEEWNQLNFVLHYGWRASCVVHGSVAFGPREGTVQHLVLWIGLLRIEKAWSRLLYLNARVQLAVLLGLQQRGTLHTTVVYSSTVVHVATWRPLSVHHGVNGLVKISVAEITCINKGTSWHQKIL